MFEKNLKMAYLLDLYGDALDGHTGAIMRAYYDDDLSLAEIADGEGISRQGVRHIIKKGEEQLEFLESRLGLSLFNKRVTDAVNRLYALEAELRLGASEEGVRIADTVHEIADTLTKGGQ